MASVLDTWVLGPSGLGSEANYIDCLKNRVEDPTFPPTVLVHDPITRALALDHTMPSQRPLVDRLDKYQYLFEEFLEVYDTRLFYKQLH